MHAILITVAICLPAGFGVGVYFAGDVKDQIAAAHTKLDAILAAVRRS